MSDLRHGSGVENGPAECGGRRLGTTQHDPAVLGVHRLERTGSVDIDAADDRHPGGPLDGRHAVPLAPTFAQYTRGVVGRLAVLRAGLAVGRHSQSKHVHADCHRYGGGLSLQPRGSAVPGIDP